MTWYKSRIVNNQLFISKIIDVNWIGYQQQAIIHINSKGRPWIMNNNRLVHSPIVDTNSSYFNGVDIIIIYGVGSIWFNRFILVRLNFNDDLREAFKSQSVPAHITISVHFRYHYALPNTHTNLNDKIFIIVSVCWLDEVNEVTISHRPNRKISGEKNVEKWREMKGKKRNN